MTPADTAIQALTDEHIHNAFNAHDEQLKGGSTLFHFNEFARELIAADRAFRALPADKTLAYCRDVRFDGTANERGIANTVIALLSASPPAPLPVPLSVDLFDVAVECCVTGQLLPGEGIEDGAERIAGVLRDNFPASPVVGDEADARYAKLYRYLRDRPWDHQGDGITVDLWEHGSGTVLCGDALDVAIETALGATKEPT